MMSVSMVVFSPPAAGSTVTASAPPFF